MAAGLFYIYDRNPAPGPPPSPPFPCPYFPPPPPLPMAVGDCYHLPNLPVVKEKQHCFCGSCVWIFYLLTRYMGLEGPWQRPFSHPLFYDRILSPTTVSYTGAPLSPNP